jgi:hypothetical protein
MPSPGDDWTEGETIEYNRGDVRWKNTWCGRVEFDNIDDIKLLTDMQECWLREYTRGQRLVYAPILSITTWTRQVAPRPAEPAPYDYYCPSRSNTIGLEIWPDNGRPRRVI